MSITVEARGTRTFVAVADAVDSVGASAEVSDTGSETLVLFRIAAGRVPAQLRADLVRAVFDLPQLRGRHRLHASVPIGDAELIDQLRRRCASVEMRAAGATCLIDADTV